MARSYDQEKIEAALEIAALLITQHPSGRAYIPIYERVEQLLAEVRAENAVVERAREFLAVRAKRIV